MDSCDFCANYAYDEEEDYYYCAVNLDEDEYEKFITNNAKECPYFIKYDEYGTVRKQN